MALIEIYSINTIYYTTKTSGAAFDNTVYESYDAWIETIRKQIKKSESTLTNIEFKKVELEAIQKYIA